MPPCMPFLSHWPFERWTMHNRIDCLIHLFCWNINWCWLLIHRNSIFNIFEAFIIIKLHRMDKSLHSHSTLFKFWVRTDIDQSWFLVVSITLSSYTCTLSTHTLALQSWFNFFPMFCQIHFYCFLQTINTECRIKITYLLQMIFYFLRWLTNRRLTFSLKWFLKFLSLLLPFSPFKSMYIYLNLIIVFVALCVKTRWK